MFHAEAERPLAKGGRAVFAPDTDKPTPETQAIVAQQVEEGLLTGQQQGGYKLFYRSGA